MIKDVRLLTSKTGARPASVNDDVREGTAMKTGSDSRAELTFIDRDRPKGRHRSNSETRRLSAAFSRLGASAGVGFGCAEREHSLALRSPGSADLW